MLFNLGIDTLIYYKITGQRKFDTNMNTKIERASKIKPEKIISFVSKYPELYEIAFGGVFAGRI